LADHRKTKLKSRRESPAPAGKRAYSTPKAVIFDIGRVIVRLEPKRAFAPLATAMRATVGQSAKPLSAEDAWEIIRADAAWLDWQEGRLSPAKWHEHLMQRFQLSLSYGEFRDAWNRVLDPELILAESLFEELGARCRLALLSNTDPIHAEYLEQRFAFVRHFPVRIYSWRVGLSKPSPAIYRKTLESLGVPASETLYIDDIKEFVDAARQVGLDAIHFKTRHLLEAELGRRQLR
jgi:putative hydrolase of the HAD superfamily